MKSLASFFHWPRLQVLASLAVLTLYAGNAGAADLVSLAENRILGENIERNVTTDGSIALRIQWRGGAIGSATVAIETDGNLTFLNAAGTADVTVVASTGVIDVSAAPYDTYGEVAATINQSTNWRCILVDVLPSWSSDNKLTAVSATAVGLTNPEGHAFAYNTADQDKQSACIGIEYSVNDQISVPNGNLWLHRSLPLLNLAGASSAPTWHNEVYLVQAVATYSSGAPDLQIYAVKNDSSSGITAPTELLLWSQVGAASTTTSTISLTGLPAIRAPRGWRLVAVYNDTSTPDLTAATIQVHGLSYNQ